MIIGLAGKKGSGKDTLGEYLIKKYNFKRYAFGDPVKEVCRILFSFSEEQLYGDKKDILDERLGIKPRECFQKIGTEFGREYFGELFPQFKNNNLWIDIFERNYKNENVVITDVRFQNEVDAINKLGGKVLLIDSIYSKDDKHKSEEINISHNAVIENRGSKEDFFKNFDYLISSNFFSSNEGSLS